MDEQTELERRTWEYEHPGIPWPGRTPPSVLDMNGCRLTLKALAYIATLLEVNGHLDVRNVLKIDDRERLTVEEWVSRMDWEEQRKPDRREGILRNLATAHDLHLFEFDGRVLFQRLATTGAFTSSLVAFLVRQTREEHDCPLQHCASFPVEGAELLACGCRVSALDLYALFGACTEKDLHATEAAFNRAHAALTNARPKETV